jgi:hypothetical protein
VKYRPISVLLHQWNAERFAWNDWNREQNAQWCAQNDWNDERNAERFARNGENGTLNGLHGTISTENGWNDLNAWLQFQNLHFRNSCYLLFSSLLYINSFKNIKKFLC